MTMIGFNTIRPLARPQAAAQQPPRVAAPVQAERPKAVEFHPGHDEEAELCDGLLAKIPLMGAEPTGDVQPELPGVDGKPGKPSVISMPSPNMSARSGAPIDTLVIHHTASPASAQRIGGFFQQPNAKVSAHYTVGRDGAIVQSVDHKDNSWHAGKSALGGVTNVNDFSIGIEICNIGDGKETYTDEQYKALAKVVAFVMAEHGIKWERVVGHKNIATPLGRKNDPSPNFSYERLKQEVEAVNAQASGRYTVQPNDSYWSIAKRVLGDGARWREIYNKNKTFGSGGVASDPNRIKEGQVLKIK